MKGAGDFVSKADLAAEVRAGTEVRRRRRREDLVGEPVVRGVAHDLDVETAGRADDLEEACAGVRAVEEQGVRVGEQAPLAGEQTRAES